MRAGRVEVRDYADTARMLDRYSPAELIGFACRLNPGLTAEDFAALRAKFAADVRTTSQGLRDRSDRSARPHEART